MRTNDIHGPNTDMFFFFFFLPSTSLWGIYSVTCVRPLQYTLHSLSRSFTSFQFYKAFLFWQLKLSRIQFSTCLKLRVLLSVPESIAKWLRHYEHDLEKERIKPNRLNLEQSRSDSTVRKMVPPGQGRGERLFSSSKSTPAQTHHCLSHLCVHSTHYGHGSSKQIPIAQQEMEEQTHGK